MPDRRAGLRPRGRPRRAAIDAAIVRAAIELLTEGGVQAATLTAVAARAGVARATVYLRWPTRSALVASAARAALGGQPLPLTDDVEDNIRVAAAFLQGVFALPTTRAMLPEIVRAVLATPSELRFEAVAPRRLEFGRLYAAGAQAAGLDPAVDRHLPFDILLGTTLATLLANGRPMSPAEAEHLADVVIEGLREA
jgi:AcrR family transcriptional regulator